MTSDELFSLIPKPLISDGKIHRFDTPNSSKGKSGWYVVKRSHKEEYIVYGDWALNTKGHFIKTLQKFNNAQVMSKFFPNCEKIFIDEHFEELVYTYTHIASSAKVKDHPYVITKRLDPQHLPNIRVIDDKLIIPMHNICTKTLQTFQFISPNGDKFFAKGYSTKMAAYILGMMYPSKVIFVCEGVATGATIYYLTQRSQTYCMMSFNGMSDDNVIEYFYYLSKAGHTIVFAIDNDKSIDVNFLLKIRRLQMNYIIPTKGKDFNDVFVEYGKETALDEFYNINILY